MKLFSFLAQGGFLGIFKGREGVTPVSNKAVAKQGKESIHPCIQLKGYHYSSFCEIIISFHHPYICLSININIKTTLITTLH